MRLLLATVGIAAVSLVLSGTLTWVLVSQLELRNAQEELGRNLLVVASELRNATCLVRSRVNPRHCLRAATSASQYLGIVEFQISSQVGGGTRMILLDRANPPGVLYDSAGQLPVGAPVGTGARVLEPLTPSPTGRPPVYTGTFRSHRAVWDFVATPIDNRFVSLLILARPQSSITAQATSQLLRPILISGAAALGLALLVTLALSHTITRPLRELRGAAEDLAAGNYGRRVGVTGDDEIGVVGQAFNRMAEAVERARAQQRDFLANVSHELKTPLTSLIGFSQALMDGSLRSEEEKARAAAILHEEAQRVLRMSQELLDLARVEAGQITFNLQAVDLGVLLKQEVELIRPRAQRRGLEIRLAFPAELHPVHADPDRLHQILENLLDNSVKYARPGTPVGIAVADGFGRVRTSVVNQVSDPAPDPARLFERFYRAAHSRGSASGAGLGLAICRELALAQGGSLTAELIPPGALAVHLELPAAGPPPSSARERQQGPPVFLPGPRRRS